MKLLRIEEDIVLNRSEKEYVHEQDR